MDGELGGDSICNTVNLESPQKLQGLTNNFGLTFTVGDAIRRCTISNRARQLELSTLNFIYFVVLPKWLQVILKPWWNELWLYTSNDRLILWPIIMD